MPGLPQMHVFSVIRLDSKVSCAESKDIFKLFYTVRSKKRAKNFGMRVALAC
jgi:hypothetical protein